MQHVHEPLVSVIIPTFNGRRWICEAIDSALAQTYPHVELIVVDDGSTDDTAQVLDNRYGEKLRYFRQLNRGPSASRNVGVGMANGTYVQFLDADDIILPTKIETQVACLRELGRGHLAHCDFDFFPDGKPDVSVSSPVEYDEKRHARSAWIALLSGNFLAIHAALVERDAIEAIGGFDEAIPNCEDYDFWLRLAHGGVRFVYNDVVLARYRKSRKSRSSHPRDQLATTLAVLDKVREYASLTDEELQIVESYRKKLRLMRLTALPPVLARCDSVIRWYVSKASGYLRHR